MIDLLCELNVYYNPKSPASRESITNHFLGNLVAPGSPLHLVVAVDTHGIVLGFAAIFFVHSLVEPAPENSRQCTLKELFVRSSGRSQGVGKSVMAWVARYALEKGCSRIDWPVNAANHRGIAFYEELGGERQRERLSYRLSMAGMARLAKEAGGM